MKTIKFMCAAFAAAMVLAGCSKEETPEEVSKNYKSVDVVISNVKMATRLGGTDQPLDNQKIQLNSLQFFFSDGSSFYQAYNENREAANTYLDATELAALGAEGSALMTAMPLFETKYLTVDQKGKSREGKHVMGAYVGE